MTGTDTFDLSGRTAFVTGASSGLGRHFAMTLAGAGARVCKHGNRAVSSSCGSADLLEALGIVVDLGPAGVAGCLEQAGIAFCLAPLFHPALRHAGPTRRSLGAPTAFNYLGPMANPAGVRRQVIGVNDPAMAERMAEVLAVTGTQRAMVVHGYPRLDEFNAVRAEANRGAHRFASALSRRLGL